MRPATLLATSLLLLVLNAPAPAQIPLMHGPEAPWAGKADVAGLNGGAPADIVTAWVQFRDKGSAGEAALDVAIRRARDESAERTLARRRKSRAPGDEVQFGDLPVHEAYVEAVTSQGLRLRIRSKWFNAISVEGARSEVQRLAELPFVVRVAPVLQLRGGRIVEETEPVDLPPSGVSKADALDYGGSLNQNEQIQTPALHELGLDGRGVIIGVLDTGIDPVSTSALDHLHVLGQRDFAGEDGSPIEEGDHGTSVLSALAGYAPGRLIGPAYGASFLLGRTEIDDREVVLETDLWIAAIEWMEEEGADIVSSSLSYLDFDDGTILVPDGVSSAITLAASAAVDRGVFVAVSAGNSGLGGITTPGDGFGVCAVGAVDAAGNTASFSSRGPTVDGRIKPDVAARGVATTVAVSGHLNRLLINSDLSSPADLIPLARSLTFNAASDHLWLTVLLMDRGIGDASIGRPGGGFPAGLRLVHRRNGAAVVLMDGPLTSEQLASPEPGGFGYDGSRVIAVNGAFQTVSGNVLDIAIRTDLSPLLPGGLLAGDVLEVTTTVRRTATVGLRIGVMTDAERGAFRSANGTSFSCPLVAGAAALLLQANPGWGPRQIMDALKRTASQSDAPDNARGWGIIRARDAALGGVVTASADLDGSGRVDVGDLLLFIGDWEGVRTVGKPLTGDALRSDLSRDARIDPADLYLLADQWSGE